MRKINKKPIIVTALALCLIVAAVGGTMAWLNSQDSLENVFTVGQFSDPDTDPTDPDNPLPEDPTKVNGHLYEPNWEANSKFVPGATITKDPMVGIGDGSEDAYVYLYVDNNTLNNKVYFKLNEGWEAVDGYVTEANVISGDPAYDNGSTTFYTGGLFKFNPTTNDGKLVASADQNAWTNAAFSNVYVKNDAVLADLADVLEDNTDTIDPNGDGVYTINVTALIHQATSGDVTDLQTDADTWAKEQATKLAQ